MRSLTHFFAGLALAFVAGVASAGAPVVVYGASGGSVVGGAIDAVAGSSDFQRLLTQSSYGDIAVADAFATRVGSSTASMALTRGLSFAGVGAFAARALPYVGAATMLYQAYDALRCKASGTAAQSGILCDAGSNPLTQQTKIYYMEGVTADAPVYGSTAQEVCVNYVSNYRSSINGKSTDGSTWTVIVTGASEDYCSFTTQRFFPGGSSGVVNGDMREIRSKVDTAGKVCPGGKPVGVDGLCPTGTFTLTSLSDAAKKFSKYTNVANALQIFKDGVTTGTDAAPYVDSPPALTGPSSTPGPVVTTTNTPAPTPSNPNPAPVVTNQNTQYNITYQGNTYTYVNTTTITNPDGSTTVKTAEQPQTKTCGLPGSPACKMDETGTPSYKPPTEDPDTLVKDDAQRRADAAASIQPPDFGFVGAPPLAECTPIQFPRDMGSVDPCGTVDTVRQVMAYLWALTASWLGLGWIRQTVST